MRPRSESIEWYRPYLKEIGICSVILVHLKLFFTSVACSVIDCITWKIETGSAERAGGRIHAVGPLCVRPQSRGLAVVGRIARPLPDLCGSVYHQIFREGKIVLIRTDGLGSRRLSLKIMKLSYFPFGSRVGSVLYCRMKREVGCRSFINKETWSSINKFIAY